MHELADIRCAHLTGIRSGRTCTAAGAGTEAESVAHIVCAALGLNTAAYSDAYVLNWASGDIDLVKACATTALRSPNIVLADVATADTPVLDIDDEPVGLPAHDGGRAVTSDREHLRRQRATLAMLAATSSRDHDSDRVTVTCRSDR